MAGYLSANTRAAAKSDFILGAEQIGQSRKNMVHVVCVETTRTGGKFFTPYSE